ncbi:dipeptide transporter; ATP-binding component of ABC superfamily [Desulfamplus magnetovallimortis]|uniref:Dipeptide transporter ATP-binding component of ABC superfamily n=1 Tax=Desulfamplus magnetovallimortis TaxID=1246637 RepID=A0A1W1HIQ2_9BACT|nr:ABC transporter ATP-binding protein [Desulfamplus magnetovallimortis]SLM32359.1 dipeptide transporter; ATP-binding component of ABC superfamily [Desulfamplus magnetovallimortis]
MELLKVNNLKTCFFSRKGTAKAVDGVTYSLNSGEVLGIVGESGCGKSVTAQSIMGIVPNPPGMIVGGEILFDGQDLVKLSPKQMRLIRGNRIAMIFQEPMTSLNPVFTIGDQISEMFVLHRKYTQKQAMEASIDMLARVQIPSPHKRVHEFPHQLSGGMRQRAMIAMALSCDPEILIADEPTTALDVTVQAQILDLMIRLKEDFGTAVQVITHDMGVIAEMADRIVVMYAGRVLEEANTIEMFQNTLHPYTQGLLKSIPLLGSRTAGKYRKLTEIKGMIPSLYSLPEGCKFCDRCPHVMELCRKQEPQLFHADNGHSVRCWLHSGEK